MGVEETAWRAHNHSVVRRRGPPWLHHDESYRERPEIGEATKPARQKLRKVLLSQKRPTAQLEAVRSTTPTSLLLVANDGTSELLDQRRLSGATTLRPRRRRSLLANGPSARGNAESRSSDLDSKPAHHQPSSGTPSGAEPLIGTSGAPPSDCARPAPTSTIITSFLRRSFGRSFRRAVWHVVEWSAASFRPTPCLRFPNLKLIAPTTPNLRHDKGRCYST